MAHGRGSLYRERWKGVNKGYVSFEKKGEIHFQERLVQSYVRSGMAQPNLTGKRNYFTRF